mmetsp:Transcript_48072/g.140085  ORF Transcript_48072/g.140085 Transcript_48072/m.140085 type:complete len:100 (-) Transcript_48072:200-499(-)
MSGFGFLDDELKEAAGGGGSRGAAPAGVAQRRPPVHWSAAKTGSQFQDQLHLADSAGPGAGGGGGGGPSLPFRIKEVQIIPKAIGNQPVFAVCKPRLKD